MRSRPLVALALALVAGLVACTAAPADPVATTTTAERRRTTTTVRRTTTTTRPSTTTTTRPPSTSTSTSTSTTTTTTAPPAAGWPGPATTGVPAGTALTSRTGDLTVTTPGTVIDGIDLQGCLYIRASNVTVRRSRITGNCWRVIEVREWEAPYPRGVVLEDVEVDGLKQSESCIAWGGWTGRRLNLHGCTDGADPSDDTVIVDSWIHDLTNAAGQHNDGVQLTGATNVRVEHCNIDVAGSGAAVMLGDEFGPLVDITLTGNRFRSGNYNLYGGWNQDTGTRPTNLTVTGNVFAGWDYGPYTYVAPNTTWSGNVDAAGRVIGLN